MSEQSPPPCETCGGPTTWDGRCLDDETQQGVGKLAAVIGAAYYENPDFAVADYADGWHFLNAALAVREHIARGQDLEVLASVIRTGASRGWTPRRIARQIRKATP